MKKMYIEPITVWMKEVAEQRLLEDTFEAMGSNTHAAAPARRGAGLDGPAGL